MSRIGGGGVPPKPPGIGPADKTADLTSKEGVQQFREAAGKDVPKKIVDTFQRAGSALEAKLQSLSGKDLAQKINFTNEDLALLARTFAEIVRQHPNADRLKRAKLFAKAILKKKGGKKRGLAKLLDDENEDHDDRDRRALEELFDMIAEQLDSTPVFAQLVDEVTESARKIR